MSTLAERALQARLSTEYRDNRSAFARAVGVSAQAIQHIEEGRTLNLNGKTLEGYVRVTGHSVSWLQSGKEPKFIGGPTSQPSTQDQPSASLTPSSELPTDALVEAIAKAMSQIPSDLVPAAAKVVESLASSPNSEMLKNHLGQMISSGRVDAKR